MADLLAISRNVLVDPTKVTAVEMISTPDGVVLMVYIGDRVFQADGDPAEVVRKIKEATPTQQYWAGK